MLKYWLGIVGLFVWGGMQYELYPSGGEGDKGRRGDNAGMEDR